MATTERVVFRYYEGQPPYWEAYALLEICHYDNVTCGRNSVAKGVGGVLSEKAINKVLHYSTGELPVYVVDAGDSNPYIGVAIIARAR